MKLINGDVKIRSHTLKLKLLHGASMIAAYGAIIICTLNAFSRPIKERPEIFVELTMVLVSFSI